MFQSTIETSHLVTCTITTFFEIYAIISLKSTQAMLHDEFIYCANNRVRNIFIILEGCKYMQIWLTYVT